MQAFEQLPRGMTRGLHRMVHLSIDGNPSTDPTHISSRPDFPDVHVEMA
jgi:hypothetical protein